MGSLGFVTGVEVFKYRWVLSPGLSSYLFSTLGSILKKMGEGVDERAHDDGDEGRDGGDESLPPSPPSTPSWCPPSTTPSTNSF